MTPRTPFFHASCRVFRLPVAFARLAVGAILLLSALPSPAQVAPKTEGPLSALPDTSQTPLKPPAPPHIRAYSAILMDAVSGQILYEKNADAPRPMASTTKIMTALLFCERVPESAVIVASARAAHTPESSLHLKTGEKLTAHDLLRAILMRSANDGCVAAAEHIAGNEETFVSMMNARAAQLGATHTHFVNSHGLHSPQHYTTARDLALIARAAIQIPQISDVVRTKTIRISRSISRDVWLKNHSRFLGHFPGADGIKTGWTIPAGRCYVGSATWNGWRLISVVLHSPDYVQETAELMKYGFYHYEPHLIAQPDEVIGQCPVKDCVCAAVPAIVKEKVQVVLQKGDKSSIDRRVEFQNVNAPIAVGANVGVLETRIGGKVLSVTPLVAQQAAAPLPMVKKILPQGSPFKWFAFAGMILTTSLVSLRYGTRNGTRFSAFTKSARRIGRRLATRLRNAHHRRQSQRQRQNRP